MRKMKTKKEIEKKIKELEAYRKELPRFSLFGDNNWETLDHQLEALKFCLTASEGDIDDKVEEIRSEFDESDPDHTDSDTQKMMTLTDPYEWVLGYVDEF